MVTHVQSKTVFLAKGTEVSSKFVDYFIAAGSLQFTDKVLPLSFRVIQDLR